MDSSSSDGNSTKSKDDKTCKQISKVVDKTVNSKGDCPIILHRVQHFKQRHNWDCGVSCVLMLLSSEQRAYFLDNFDTICKEEGFGQSTWTIDLCYLLKRFGIKHCMYSAMIGVNENHKKLKYYKNIMELDRERIQTRLDEAEARGIPVREGTLSPRDLRDHLVTRGPAIALVDSGLLACDLCKHNKLKVEFRRCFGGEYTGHYILLVGYNPRNDKLVYRDPAMRAGGDGDRGGGGGLCAVAASRLHAARTAPGTDHDLVLIYHDYR